MEVQRWACTSSCRRRPYLGALQARTYRQTYRPRARQLMIQICHKKRFSRLLLVHSFQLAQLHTYFVHYLVISTSQSIPNRNQSLNMYCSVCSSLSREIREFSHAGRESRATVYHLAFFIPFLWLPNTLSPPPSAPQTQSTRKIATCMNSTTHI